MSSIALAVVASLVSLLPLSALGLTDPKSKKWSKERLPALHRLRYGFTLAILVPGIVLAAMGNAVAFLIWFGFTAIAGWVVALIIAQARGT